MAAVAATAVVAEAVTETEEAVKEEVAEVVVEEAKVVEEVAVTATEAPVVEEVAVAAVDTQSLDHQAQLREMEVKHREAMMKQQQDMMNYFSQMMLKQNAEPKLDANGKPVKVQRVIIVPVPAYSYGLNAGSHMTGSYGAMHEMHHGKHTMEEKKESGNVVEPVK